MRNASWTKQQRSPSIRSGQCVRARLPGVGAGPAARSGFRTPRTGPGVREEGALPRAAPAGEGGYHRQPYAASTSKKRRTGGGESTPRPPYEHPGLPGPGPPRETRRPCPRLTRPPPPRIRILPSTSARPTRRLVNRYGTPRPTRVPRSQGHRAPRGCSYAKDMPWTTRWARLWLFEPDVRRGALWISQMAERTGPKLDLPGGLGLKILPQLPRRSVKRTRTTARCAPELLSPRALVAFEQVGRGPPPG